MTAFAAVSLQAASEPVGDIIQIQGKWYIAARAAPLVAGDSVSAGALIKPDPSKGLGSVVVALLNGQQLSATCTIAPCLASLKIPEGSLHPDISFKNTLAAVEFVLLNRGPKVAAAFESTSSRGIAGTRSEMLLPFDAGKTVSFRPDLPGLVNGRYHLDVLRLEDRKIVYSDEVQWDASDMHLSLPLMEAGSYGVSLTDRLGRKAADVFLALVEVGSYEKVLAAYEEARSTCSQWAGPQASESSHLFLRAYLLALEERK